jgi:hypothetical protein
MNRACIFINPILSEIFLVLMSVFVHLIYISEVRRYLYLLTEEKSESCILLILICLTTIYQLNSLCCVERYDYSMSDDFEGV